MSTPIRIITVSEDIYRRLQRQAQTTRQSVDELAQRTLSRHLPSLVEVEHDLPEHIQVELKAMENLSDAALWAIAQSTLSRQEQNELTELADIQDMRLLTEEEQERQEALLVAYDEAVLRRAHAAVLLKARGYDVSDPLASSTGLIGQSD
jgi:hypothetical protein